MFSALCRQRDYRPDLIATVTRHGWIGIEVNEHSDIPPRTLDVFCRAGYRILRKVCNDQLRESNSHQRLPESRQFVLQRTKKATGLILRGELFKVSLIPSNGAAEGLFIF
jgi:hypothetical protein